MIERLVYRSCAVGTLPELALDRIFQSSAPRNARLSITGALGYSHMTYIQLLEGPPSAIDEILHRLENDPRHTDLTILLRGVTHRRLLPGWSMARVDLSRVAPELEARVKNNDGLGLVALMATLAHEGVAT